MLASHQTYIADAWEQMALSTITKPHVWSFHFYYQEFLQINFSERGNSFRLMKHYEKISHISYSKDHFHLSSFMYVDTFLQREMACTEQGI